ncbi:hypothetical protein AVEN_143760-1 [Araneus ventricosus]|uniref:Uncharacterized protein n=1 Tax=Araneus ventricosus TaxID=182803 RepID=A0A4Y2ANN0_ARAVE|nr:hypothetical protein AVEN_143760-1 [Araneus ventricosus]
MGNAPFRRNKSAAEEDSTQVSKCAFCCTVAISDSTRDSIVTFQRCFRLEYRNYQSPNESKYNVFGSDGKQMVWRKPNTELEMKNPTPSVKHGGGSQMVWGCMSAVGVGNLHLLME